MTRRRVRARALAPLALLAALGGVRLALEPAESRPPDVERSPAALERLGARARASEVGGERLRAELRGIDVLLVGETHFHREPPAFLCELLEAVEGRRVVLLLELPAGMQPMVDEWVGSGSSPALAAAIREGDALPYGEILDWASRHRHRLSGVVAMDEDRARIVWNRTLLRDTRNDTMAQAVLWARREHPDDLAVAYGGQMHMLLAGRYRYDREDRTPAGARLLRAGVPRERLRSVLLSGSGQAPIDEAWPGPGVLALSGPVGEEPWPYFIDEAVFGAESGRELFDHFVHLGPLTPAPE